MATHQFLSPEWMEAARKIREEYDGRVPAPDEWWSLPLSMLDPYK